MLNMIRALVFSLAVLSCSSIFLESRQVENDNKKLTTYLEYFALSDAENDFCQADERNPRFFIVNFEKFDVKIMKLALTGHGVKNQFVSKFKLEASFDGRDFYPVNGGHPYDGNNDCHRKIETYFYNGLPAKFLKFIPLEYYGDISFKLWITYAYLTPSDVFPKEKVVTKGDGFDYSQLSIWERIGGKISLARAVNEMIVILRANPNFNAPLKPAFIEFFRQNLLEFFQVLLGGSRNCDGHDCALNLYYFGVQAHQFDSFIKILILGFKNATTLDNQIIELILKQLYFNKFSIVRSF
jgi:hypothetical protein